MKTPNLKEGLLTYYASIEDRDMGVQLVKKHPKLFEDLLELAFSKEQNRENIVASWVLERLVLKEKHIDFVSCFEKFIKAFKHQTHESKRRPFAKLLYHHCKIVQNRERMSSKTIDLIIENCFDTLLEAKKVAPKVFVIKTLVYFKNHREWIAPELKAYIQKELPNSSAAFKSTLRQIMPF